MTSNNITSQEAMEAKFLPIDDALKIAGEPNLPRMFPLLKHMVRCARTQRSPLCYANMIFLALNETLFANYSNDDYPTEMEDYPEPDPSPNYDAATDSNERAALKHGWEYDCKIHYEAKT